MSKFSNVLILFLITLLEMFGQSPSADEIIQKVDKVMNPSTVYSKTRMINVLESGKKRTFEYESWAIHHGEKMLIRYTSPRRLEGQAILLLNHADDIWMYFPRTNRVRKMATHAKKQKFEGSNFTYEDFGSGDIFIKKFNARLLDEEKKQGKDCYKLELTRKSGADISYSRLILWVDKQLFIPLEIEYYHDKDPKRLIKRLIMEDIEVIQGIPTAKKMTMANAENDSQTIMQLLDVKYQVNIPEDMFTERALRRR